MNLKSLSNFRTLSVLIIFIPLFVYIIYRGYHLSFTHDESLSYTMVKGIEDWVNTANNHYLNTKLMGVMSRLFGIQEWSLRLPNMLSFILFFSGIHLIIKADTRQWLIIFTLLFIMLNPFLLEYFSLARGYGLSLGLLMLSIYYLLRNGWINEETTNFHKDFFLSILFGALAMGANLALINFYIATLILFTIKLFIKQRDYSASNRLKVIGIYIGSIIPLFFAIKHLLVLKEYQQLYFGSEQLRDMFKTLIELSVYYNFDVSLLITIVISVLMILVSIGLFILLKTKKLTTQFFLFNCLILLVFGGMFFEKILFDAKYPIERTALFLWPLIGLYLFFFIQLLNPRKIAYQLVAFIAVVFLLIPLALNFKEGCNLTHTRQWFYDKHSKDVMHIIKKNHDNSSQKVIRCNWIFNPSLSYYNDLLRMDFQLINEDIEDDRFPWLYNFENSEHPSDLAVFQYYNDIRCELLKQK